MKHVVPIIAFILSICVFFMSALSLTLLAIVVSIGASIAITAFAVPCLVIALVLDAFAIGTNALLLKHKLSFAGFIISLVAAVIIVAAFVVIFSM